ncbi:hypothetical protein FH972_008342 [Carpinus fangiana]|uniref:Uncharacterized protein n=1 Tax=Carpinus fangiana TaxID=176857 RepID=A0A5N6R0Q9_9ROSI|nr:hypothetical protein FH972_008342 [Carpinus fangiana]
MGWPKPTGGGSHGRHTEIKDSSSQCQSRVPAICAQILPKSLRKFYNRRSTRGSGADEERNRRAEDGIGEGALEEQENQAARLDGGRSYFLRSLWFSVSTFFLFPQGVGLSSNM